MERYFLMASSAQCYWREPSPPVDLPGEKKIWLFQDGQNLILPEPQEDVIELAWEDCDRPEVEYGLRGVKENAKKVQRKRKLKHFLGGNMERIVKQRTQVIWI